MNNEVSFGIFCILNFSTESDDRNKAKINKTLVQLIVNKKWILMCVMLAQSSPVLYHAEDFFKTGVVGIVTLIAEQNITDFFKNT